MLMTTSSPQLTGSYNTWYEEVRADSAEVREKYIERCECLCRVEPDDKLFYPRLVDALLHALPVLESNHMELFNRLIEKTKQVMDVDAERFLRYYKLSVKFLMKVGMNLTSRNFYVPCLDERTCPLRRLDICYTLLKIGDVFPFNCVEIEREEIERVRRVLLSIGAREVREAWLEISESKIPIPEMERYHLRHA